MTRPARDAASTATVRIARTHHPLVRLTHWINVPILLGLIASGLSIYWAAPVFTHAPDPSNGSREYLRDIGYVIGRALRDPVGSAWVYDRLGLGTRQLAIALRLHWLLAYLFMLNGLIYLIGLIRGGGWRALLPRPSDAVDALRMIRYYLGVIPMAMRRRPWPHPVIASRYNALQRGAYFSVLGFSALAVLSGWAMHKPVQLGWLERLFVSYDGARIVHFVSMLVLASFIVPHVILVIADGWDTFRSMVTGWTARLKEERHERT